MRQNIIFEKCLNRSESYPFRCVRIIKRLNKGVDRAVKIQKPTTTLPLQASKLMEENGVTKFAFQLAQTLTKMRAFESVVIECRLYNILSTMRNFSNSLDIIINHS